MAIVMIGGFKHHGLEGLGVGMLLSNLFDWLSVWLITKLRYNFAYSRRVWKLSIVQFPILIVMLAVCIYTHSWVYVCGGAIVTIGAATYSIHFLHHNTTFTHHLLSKVRSKVPIKKATNENKG